MITIIAVARMEHDGVDEEMNKLGCSTASMTKYAPFRIDNWKPSPYRSSMVSMITENQIFEACALKMFAIYLDLLNPFAMASLSYS